MKGIRRFFLYFTILLIISVTLLFLAAGSFRYTRVDGIMLNDIVQTVKENWDDLSTLDENAPDTDLLILDSNGKRLYAEPEKTFAGVNGVLDAIKLGMITAPVNDGN